MPYLDPSAAFHRKSFRVAVERVVHAINAGPSGVRVLAGVGPNEDVRDEQVEVIQPSNPT
jgi:hypothetical protein